MENYVGKICPFCKTAISAEDEVMVCPSCATPHHKACWDENKDCTTFGCSKQHYVAQGTNPTDVCKKCGHKVGLAVDSGVNSAIAEFNAKQTKKNKKKIVIPLVITGLLAVGGITAYMLLKPIPVEEIILSKESVELKKDGTQSVSYTISPPEASEKEEGIL